MFRRSYECFVMLSLRLVTNKGPPYVSLRCHDDHVHKFEERAQQCASPSEHGHQDGVVPSGRVLSVIDDADDHSDTCNGIAFGYVICRYGNFKLFALIHLSRVTGVCEFQLHSHSNMIRSGLTCREGWYTTTKLAGHPW